MILASRRLRACSHHLFACGWIGLRAATLAELCEPAWPRLGRF